MGFNPTNTKSIIIAKIYENIRNKGWFTQVRLAMIPNKGEWFQNMNHLGIPDCNGWFLNYTWDNPRNLAHCASNGIAKHFINGNMDREGLRTLTCGSDTNCLLRNSGIELTSCWMRRLQETSGNIRKPQVCWKITKTKTNQGTRMQSRNLIWNYTSIDWPQTATTHVSTKVMCNSKFMELSGTLLSSVLLLHYFNCTNTRQ